MRTLIEREAADSAGVEVVFDAPTKEGIAWQTSATLATSATRPAGSSTRTAAAPRFRDRCACRRSAAPSPSPHRRRSPGPAADANRSGPPTGTHARRPHQRTGRRTRRPPPATPPPASAERIAHQLIRQRSSSGRLLFYVLGTDYLPNPRLPAPVLLVELSGPTGRYVLHAHPQVLIIPPR